jgi:hypothetical protein
MTDLIGGACEGRGIVSCEPVVLGYRVSAFYLGVRERSVTSACMLRLQRCLDSRLRHGRQ